MQEKRRHQRIRFGQPPPIAIGYAGTIGAGALENLSLSGMMLRTGMELEVGRRIGCEFSIFGSPIIDLAAVVVSRVGNLFGARIETGPISQVLLDDAMRAAIADGYASTLTMHDVGGRKIMRIAGGLNGSLRNDFMHGLTRVGVDEIDAAEVTAVDQEGIALCLVAQGRHGVRIGQQSECFAKAWREALRVPGSNNGI